VRGLLFIYIFLSLFSCKSFIYCKKVENSKEVYIGLVAPILTEAKSLLHGINTAFYEANEKNDGVVLKCLALNDHNQFTLGVSQIKDAFMLYKKTSIFMNIFNQGSLEQVLPYVLDKKILIYSTSNDDKLMDPKYKYLINTQPPISREYEAIIDYAVNVLKRGRFAIFYPEDSSGVDAVKNIEKFLGKYNLKPIVKISHSSAVLALDPVVETIIKTQPDALVFATNEYQAYYLCLALVRASFYSCCFLGTSVVLPIQKYLQETRGIRIFATSVVPDPENSNLLFVQNFRKNIEKYYPNTPLTFFLLFSYLGAKFLAAIIKSLNGEITMEKIVQKMESIKNYDLEGLTFNFNPEIRSVFEGLWISPGKNQPWIDVSKNKYSGQKVAGDEK